MRRVVVWSLFTAFVYTFFLAEGGLASIVWRRARVRQLEQDIAALEHREAWLLREWNLRKGDRGAIERLARERYGMAYPGDKVYRIVQIPEAKARALEDEKSRIPEESTVSDD